MEIGVWILFSALIITALIVVIDAIRLGIGPVVSSPKVKQETLLLCDKAPKRKKIAELGSGWGTLALALQDRYPDSTVDAYEAAWISWLFQRILLLIRTKQRFNLYRKDFFQTELSSYDLVVCYLYPEAMEKLSVKLRNELKPGSCIVTHTFRLPGWEIVEEKRCKDLYRTPVYLYRV